MGKCWRREKLSHYLGNLIKNNSSQGQSHGGTNKKWRSREKKSFTWRRGDPQCPWVRLEGSRSRNGTKGIRVKGMRKREGGDAASWTRFTNGEEAHADTRVAMNLHDSRGVAMEIAVRNDKTESEGWWTRIFGWSSTAAVVFETCAMNGAKCCTEILNSNALDEVKLLGYFLLSR